MTQLHNATLIGPDGTTYRLIKIDESVKSSVKELGVQEDVGEQIRRLRKQKKWSQTKLGVLAGKITQATISRIETEKTEAPHPTTVVELLRVLTEG